MRHPLRHIIAASTTALVLGTAGIAAAGSYNWGSNGSGACTDGSPNASAEWSAGTCVMSLSGWAPIKGWTIANPVQSCEDTVDGPYPTVPGGNNGSPSGLAAGPFYASVQYLTNTMGSGWAWQGNDMSGDMPMNSPTEGSISASGVVNTWGTATGAFGNGDVDTQNAQYAAGCANVTGAGALSGLVSNARSDVAAAPRMDFQMRFNAHPAARLLSYRTVGGGRGVQRRVTLASGTHRTVSVQCPGTTLRQSAQVWPEFAPADGRAPSASRIRSSHINIIQRSSRRGHSVTVRTGRLAYTTMLQVQVTCK